MLLTFTCLLFTSCKDDDDEPAAPPTEEELIAGKDTKTWKIQYITVMGVVQEPEECNTDDELVFYSNKDLIYKNNDLKCTFAEPSTMAGKWSLSEDKKMINISAGPITGTAAIDDLTADRLKITSNTIGVPVTILMIPKQ